MRIGDVESGAAEDARQVAHQIEMRQIRSLAQLGVAQAIAARLDLGKTGERPGRRHTLARSRPRCRCGTLDRRPSVHTPQEEESQPLHLIEVAG